MSIKRKFYILPNFHFELNSGDEWEEPFFYCRYNWLYAESELRINGPVYSHYKTLKGLFFWFALFDSILCFIASLAILGLIAGCLIPKLF